MRQRIAILAVIGAMTASTQAVAQQPAKQAPPPLSTPKPFVLPPKSGFTLANGMKVTLVPFGKVPKVTVVASVLTGNIDEKANEVWLADVTGEMMREGTTSRSASDIATQVAGMGGQLSVTVASDYSRVSSTVLSENGANVVAIIADVLRNPAFPESQLARIVATKAREVAIARTTPQSIAQEKFFATMYGEHPYGRLYPTEAMLKGYTIANVKDFHARNFSAARTHLYVVGVFDAQAVEAAVRKAFGDWPRGAARAPNVPKLKPARSFALIDRPDAVQSTIIMGLPVPDPTAKDYAALEVTDALLGGAFGSRITANIREQKGYAYSPFSSLDTRYRTANWSEQADVTTKFTGESLKEILGEIARLQQTAPGAAELEGIKNNMVGIFTLQNATRGGIVNQLANVDMQGLPENHLSTYVQRVLAVTPEDVRLIARNYLRPESMTIVIVGDKKTVEAQVAPYAGR